MTICHEYQAIIAYTVYSQVLKGAAYTDIARELEKHAGEELQHALKLAKQVVYLGGMPAVTANSWSPSTWRSAAEYTKGRWRDTNAVKAFSEPVFA